MDSRYFLFAKTSGDTYYRVSTATIPEGKAHGWENILRQFNYPFKDQETYVVQYGGGINEASAGDGLYIFKAEAVHTFEFVGL